MLLCGILGLAAWSNWGDRSFEFGFNGSLWQLAAEKGGLSINNEAQRELDERPMLWLRWRSKLLVEKSEQAAGLSELMRIQNQWATTSNLLSRLSMKPRLSPVRWSVSYSVLFVLVALLPAARLASSVVHARQRQTLRRRGLCDQCGYDIRESVGVCPECGNPVPALHRTASDYAEKLRRLG